MNPQSEQERLRADTEKILERNRAEIVPVEELRRLRESNAELTAALKTLTELGENVPIFQLDGGKSSVKAVRLAGKFTVAMSNARAALKKAVIE